MNSSYIYLIASLPMLHFGLKPPFTLADFLRRCREFALEEDFAVLSNLPQPQDYSTGKELNPTIQAWADFDIALKNELVKIRSSRKHIDPAPYLRKDGFTNSAISHLALAAHRNPMMLEAEKSLDEARWRKLDELTAGHYFDLNFLITYTYKLMILERWEKINTADKEALLEKTFTEGQWGTNAG